MTLFRFKNILNLDAWTDQPKTQDELHSNKSTTKTLKEQQLTRERRASDAVMVVDRRPATRLCDACRILATDSLDISVLS
jgi:hypothetical protein